MDPINWVIPLHDVPYDFDECTTFLTDNEEINIKHEQSGEYHMYSSSINGLTSTQIKATTSDLINKINDILGDGRITMGIPFGFRADGMKVTLVTMDAGMPLEFLATSFDMANFAEDWFNDARNEATKETAAARRREIIFAVCTAESYLLEWTRDILLRHYPNKTELPDRLNKYFPEDEKSPIIYKWNVVPKKLYRHKLIKGKPGLTAQTWQTWKRFKDEVYKYYRNSLIHATVSRPRKRETIFVSPLPDWKEELQNLEPGWAIKTVAQLIRDLNAKAGTCAPGWVDKV